MGEIREEKGGTGRDGKHGETVDESSDKREFGVSFIEVLGEGWGSPQVRKSVVSLLRIGYPLRNVRKILAQEGIFLKIVGIWGCFS